MDWHGDEFLAAVRDRLATNLGNAAGLVQDRAVESINDAYPPASEPGSPPHRRTGNLRASMTHEVDATTLTARIGSPVDYALYLETGTHRMAARPFLRPALAERLDAVKAAAVDGIGTPTE